MDAVPTEVSLEQWVEDRWTDLDKDPAFHRRAYSPSLVKYYDKLFTKDMCSKVFIPLCGKTLDMIYLADKGHEVVGLEYSEGAIKRFHEENALTYTEEKLNGVPFTVYHTKEKNIKIYQGDLFDMNFDICGQFDVVFDRGSYVAINVDTHKAYADLMSSLIKAGGQILMEALSYKSSTFGGPPHCISLEDIESNFTEFKISTLEMDESETKPPIIVDNMKLVRRITLLQRI